MRLNFSCYKYYTFSPVVEIFSNSSKFAGIYKTSWRKLKGFCSRSYSVILIVILIIRYAEAITRVAYVFDRIQRNAYLVSLSRISSWFRVSSGLPQLSAVHTLSINYLVFHPGQPPSINKIRSRPIRVPVYWRGTANFTLCKTMLLVKPTDWLVKPTTAFSDRTPIDASRRSCNYRSLALGKRCNFPMTFNRERKFSHETVN